MKNITSFAWSESPSRRRGLVLIIVLIVVAVLSLSAYAFSSLMVMQSEATQLNGRRVQARMLASSGIESLRVFLLQDLAVRSESGGLYDNPAMFQGVTVLDEGTPEDLGKFTILVPSVDSADGTEGVRYGLEDESARLNLNALLLIDQQARELQEAAGGVTELVEGVEGMEGAEDLLSDNPARNLLMALPGMTVEIADAILDWLDEDDEQREFGAEAEYYASLAPPYAPKNGPLETVEELLLVRGVTPQLLFGCDVNRNGMVDPDEMTLAGQLGDLPQRGWSAYLTLHSKEQNINTVGEPRIDLNMDDLQQLYDVLGLVFPEEWVKFIIAYRQSGPYQGEEEGEDDYSGELNLSQEGGNKFTQVLDLIGSRVEVTFQGAEEPVVLRSPFLDDLVSMAVYMPELMDNVTVVPDTVIPGRISLSQASPEILMGIPGMTEEIVEQILSQRVPEPGLDDPGQKHETWLLTSGIVTLEEMRALIPFVCGGGDVYRTQVVGYFEDGRASARVEVVLDATQLPPRVLLWRDISHLGRGYPLEMLGVSLVDEN
jgi:type II secretory pathway component PulK